MTGCYPCRVGVKSVLRPNCNQEILKVKAARRESPGLTLYNLKEDIGESHNVMDDHSELADRLASALEAHSLRTPVG